YEYETVQGRGREFARSNPTFFHDEIAKGRSGDVAIILYTSGTTGRPKGVVLSFDNIVTSAKNAIAFEGLTDREEVLAYLPMARISSPTLKPTALDFAPPARNRRRRSWPICANSAPPISSRRHASTRISSRR